MSLPGRPRSRRLRAVRERFIIGALFACGVFSILTTTAIIVMLVGETTRFFRLPDVSVAEFFTGLEWAPLLGAEHKFGVWPLVNGTLLVTLMASMVSIPLGLITAVYLSEYAPRRVRGVLKPALEILAGIPTVVYGYFALTVITPSLQFLHEGFNSYNAMAAGIAVGIMTLPTVSSLSEDALRAVPKSLRQGAYAAGGTRFDVSLKIVLPAGLSGVVAAFLLAIARAVGETMIVALAAGGTAVLTLDPRDSVQTLTAYMVQIALGDAPAGGVEYYSIYAVGLVLFVMTMAVTLSGHYLRNRFREEYA